MYVIADILNGHRKDGSLQPAAIVFWCGNVKGPTWNENLAHAKVGNRKIMGLLAKSLRKSKVLSFDEAKVAVDYYRKNLHNF
jgi:hypothetical protein